MGLSPLCALPAPTAGAQDPPLEDGLDDPDVVSAELGAASADRAEVGAGARQLIGLNNPLMVTS